MSSSASPVVSASASSSPSPFTNSNQNSSGISSSLYLFTFLITVLVLGAISGILLFRAYYVRRRYQAQVEEAIRNNQPVPVQAARALGLWRPERGRGGRGGKPEERLGPMPGMWEVQMVLDRKAGEARTESKDRDGGGDRGLRRWDEFTPVSVVHFPSNPDPEPFIPQYIIPPPTTRRFTPSWVPTRRPLPRIAVLPEQTLANIPRAGPKYTIPPAGEEVTVGVLIALPFEEKAGNPWERKDHDGEGEVEGEVPQVLLGVVAVRTE